ncbi:MAG: cysteine desulfurase [Alphaproteobacteria bacterium]|nr:cysteine desulfurase [Alphaproteobacteria bacterium]
MSEIIYLDHNSTTYPLEGLNNYLAPYMQVAMNPSSIHQSGREARKILESARSAIRDSLNITLGTNGRRIIFTASATEANNLVINNFQNDIILFSPTSHISVIEPTTRALHGIEIMLDRDGLIDLAALEAQLIEYKDKKLLVSITMANNETGIIEPLGDIGDLVHSYGGFLHADCVQAYGKIHIKHLIEKIDFITISSHKIGGLAGAGALIAPHDFDISPLIQGGGQEQRLRSGTESMIPIISFGFAATKITEVTQIYQEKIKNFRDFVEEALSSASNSAIIIGKNQDRLPNTSMIAMKGVDSRLQLMKFDMKGICLSNGAACSSGVVKHSHVLRAMGYEEEILDSAIRVSFGINNTIEDAEMFVSAWKEIERNYDVK